MRRVTDILGGLFAHLRCHRKNICLVKQNDFRIPVSQITNRDEINVDEYNLKCRTRLTLVQ